MRTAAGVAASGALVVAAVGSTAIVSTAIVSTALVSAPVARAEAPAHQLEGRRIRAGAVYVGTVSAVRRLGSLDGLSGDTQGRMEATVQMAKPLRGPAGAPAEAALRFDTRAPEAEGEGYYTLASGEAVLVFTDQVAEPAYPRELLHGAPEALAAEVKGLRDALLAMDADLLRLNGVTPSARAAQVRLYDQALAALSRLTATR